MGIGFSDIKEVASFGISIFAIWQARHYFIKSKELNKETDKLMNTMQQKLDAMFVVQRNMDHAFPSNGSLLNLKKDCVVIRKTTEFKPNREVEIVDRLRDLLSPILKDSYIEHVMAYVIGTTEEKECIVCLRHEMKEQDEEKKIEEIRSELNENGLDICILF